MPVSRIAMLEGFNGFGAARGKKRKGKRSAKRSTKAKRSGGMTPQQRRFKVAAKACWAEMAAGGRKVSPKALGSCMRSHLKK